MRLTGLIWNDPRVVARFLARCEPCPHCECVLFKGSIARGGWGRIVAHGFPGCPSGRVYAHRYIYALVFGAPELGEDVHHQHDICGHRNCVNPYHLETIRHTEHALVSNARRWTDTDVDVEFVF